MADATNAAAAARMGESLAQQERRELVLGEMGWPAGAHALLLPVVVVRPGVGHVAEDVVVHVRELQPQTLHAVYIKVVLLRMREEVG